MDPVQWLDLVRVLSVKNFRQRYLRSRLGVVWALIQPLAQAAVLSFVFLKIFKVHKVPHYPLYVLSGIMSWQFFQQSVVGGTSAVVDNSGLVRKVAVPKITFPLSVVGGVLLVFVLQLVVLVAGAGVTGTLVTTTPLLLALSVVVELALAVGFSVLLCSLHVSFRDIRFLVESTFVMAFYLTPVIYDPSRLPPTYRSVMRWNPMDGVLSLERAALLARSVDWAAVGVSGAAALLLLAVGIPVFRRRAGDFADQV
ncbi:MAG TPA: ABC transporter permease [Mycobacteriales bacterium]|nr:ABC transporter permease [Mycobacteriales bacterium]